MSITQKEAIELKAAVGRLMYSDNKDIRDYNALIDFIDAALRPVSREQVEKVWRGEWRLDEEKSKKHVEPIYVCTRCKNFEAWGDTEKTNFCGFCGAPMTDEAVQMVMERDVWTTTSGLSN